MTQNSILKESVFESGVLANRYLNNQRKKYPQRFYLMRYDLSGPTKKYCVLEIKKFHSALQNRGRS